MSQLFTILDDKIVINKAVIGQIEGPTTFTGLLDISGDTTVHNNLTVQGRLVVDVIEANQVIDRSSKTNTASAPASSTIFTADEETLLNGQGFTWIAGQDQNTLAYRTGSRLGTSLNLDLDLGRSYKIDNIDVLTHNTLGSSISRSSLRQLGPLNNLTVVGNVEVGQFFYVDSDTNRIGIDTEAPNGKLSVVENGAEFIVGSSVQGTIKVGTYSSHDVAIVTDDTARITIKNSGDVYVGNSNSRNVKFVVHGSIQAESIITETKIERTDSVKFLATDGSSYGVGLAWTGVGSPKQLVLNSGPDRIWSSEHFDLAANRNYLVGGKVVLSETALGTTVTQSNLTSVGVLDSLSVTGNASTGSIQTTSISTHSLTVGSDHQVLSVSETGISSTLSVSLTVAGDHVFYADPNTITIGSKESTRKNIRTFGTLSVNVNNPDPELSLAVDGNIGFAGRKFITGASAPEQGNYNVGDICWNTTPMIGGCVGWICLSPGTPGMWSKFGTIG